MNELPESIRPVLRRLSRRLTLGLFLDAWPAWAVASLLMAGVAVLACRLFFPAASPYLHWLWLAPLLAFVPALVTCVRRRYRIEQVAAIADWLSGGQGLLLTLLEKGDSRWAESFTEGRASGIPLPRLRPGRRLAPVLPAAAFLAAAFWVPQRVPPPSQALLADEIARDLTATLEELKQQDLVTAEEEQSLEEEIERIRRAADERVDAASWEAADAVRERLVAELTAKQEAVKWAEESARRYLAAAEGASDGSADPQALSAELADAVDKLAKSGLLEGAPAELRDKLKGGRLQGDPRALRELTASIAKYLQETNGRFGELARLGKEFGRFDPSEFPLAESADEGGEPGAGGVNRGRGDAPLTWGKESLPTDRFKSAPLPPGAARSPDDWAPLVELPGSPGESAVLSTASAARRYAPSAGQAAWRRTLAPRHQSAVKKYFAR